MGLAPFKVPSTQPVVQRDARPADIAAARGLAGGRRAGAPIVAAVQGGGDGKETYGGEPCELVADLTKSGIAFVLRVVLADGQEVVKEVSF